MSPLAAMPPTLQDNLASVRARIEAACANAGRSARDVRLLPVTKSVDAQRTAQLVRLLAGEGPVDLAENRVEALETKQRALAGLDLPPLRWHFVGHLQRNKARRVVRLCHVLHSVDSLRLLETLERLCAEEGTRLEIYLQVALTGEAQKDGLDEGQLLECFAAMPSLEHLDLAGLMAMGPRPDSGTRALDVFARAAALAHGLESQARHESGPARFVRARCELSMGMSADLEAAVAAGSHQVRVGSALVAPSPSGAYDA